MVFAKQPLQLNHFQVFFFKKSNKKSLAKAVCALLNYFINSMTQWLHMSLQLKTQKLPSRFHHTPERKALPPFRVRGGPWRGGARIYPCHVMAELELRLAACPAASFGEKSTPLHLLFLPDIRLLRLMNLGTCHHFPPRRIALVSSKRWWQQDQDGISMTFPYCWRKCQLSYIWM